MINPVKYSQKQTVQTKQEESRFVNILQVMQGGRWWACDHLSLCGGVSLIRSCLALGAEIPPAPEQSQLIELFRRISEFESSLIQHWKQPAPPALPEVWRDPITGENLRNPWLEPQDKKAMNVLLQTDPALAEAYKALAADPYKFVADQRAEAARRKALNAITFTAKDWDTNPYRNTSVNGAQAQGIFRQLHGDLVASVWKMEAAPVRLPWSGGALNRTSCGKIIEALEQKPVIGIGGGDCVLLAMEFSKRMIQAEREAAEREAEAAEKKAAALRAA